MACEYRSLAIGSTVWSRATGVKPAFEGEIVRIIRPDPDKGPTQYVVRDPADGAEWLREARELS